MRIAELRDRVAKTAFKQLVLDGGWELQAGTAHALRFDPVVYPVPANKHYGGKFRFAKHLHPVVADLEDGGEQSLCALAIDSRPKFRRWVCKLDSDPVAAFWLPTSAGHFYRDFVCEPMDGRGLDAEFKGEPPRAVPKAIEKGHRSARSGPKPVPAGLCSRRCSSSSAA